LSGEDNEQTAVFGLLNGATAMRVTVPVIGR
jgi:hypothetical protein